LEEEEEGGGGWRVEWGKVSTVDRELIE